MNKKKKIFSKIPFSQELNTINKDNSRDRHWLKSKLCGTSCMSSLQGAETAMGGLDEFIKFIKLPSGDPDVSPGGLSDIASGMSRGIGQLGHFLENLFTLKWISAVTDIMEAAKRRIVAGWKNDSFIRKYNSLLEYIKNSILPGGMYWKTLAMAIATQQGEATIYSAQQYLDEIDLGIKLLNTIDYLYFRKDNTLNSFQTKIAMIIDQDREYRNIYEYKYIIDTITSKETDIDITNKGVILSKEEAYKYSSIFEIPNNISNELNNDFLNNKKLKPRDLLLEILIRFNYGNRELSLKFISSLSLAILSSSRDNAKTADLWFSSRGYQKQITDILESVGQEIEKIENINRKGTRYSDGFPNKTYWDIIKRIDENQFDEVEIYKDFLNSNLKIEKRNDYWTSIKIYCPLNKEKMGGLVDYIVESLEIRKLEPFNDENMSIFIEDELVLIILIGAWLKKEQNSINNWDNFNDLKEAILKDDYDESAAWILQEYSLSDILTPIFIMRLRLFLFIISDNNLKNTLEYSSDNTFKRIFGWNKNETSPNFDNYIVDNYHINYIELFTGFRYMIPFGRDNMNTTHVKFIKFINNIMNDERRKINIEINRILPSKDNAYWNCANRIDGSVNWINNSVIRWKFNIDSSKSNSSDVSVNNIINSDLRESLIGFRRNRDEYKLNINYYLDKSLFEKLEKNSVNEKQKNKISDTFFASYRDICDEMIQLRDDRNGQTLWSLGHIYNNIMRFTGEEGGININNSYKIPLIEYNLQDDIGWEQEDRKKISGEENTYESYNKQHVLPRFLMSDEIIESFMGKMEWSIGQIGAIPGIIANELTIAQNSPLIGHSVIWDYCNYDNNCNIDYHKQHIYVNWLKYYYIVTNNRLEWEDLYRYNILSKEQIGKWIKISDHKDNIKSLLTDFKDLQNKVENKETLNIGYNEYINSYNTLQEQLVNNIGSLDPEFIETNISKQVKFKLTITKENKIIQAELPDNTDITDNDGFVISNNDSNTHERIPNYIYKVKVTGGNPKKIELKILNEDKIHFTFEDKFKVNKVGYIIKNYSNMKQKPTEVINNPDDYVWIPKYSGYMPSIQAYMDGYFIIPGINERATSAGFLKSKRQTGLKKGFDIFLHYRLFNKDWNNDDTFYTFMGKSEEDLNNRLCKYVNQFSGIDNIDELPETIKYKVDLLAKMVGLETEKNGFVAWTKITTYCNHNCKYNKECIVDNPGYTVGSLKLTEPEMTIMKDILPPSYLDSIKMITNKQNQSGGEASVNIKYIDDKLSNTSKYILQRLSIVKNGENLNINNIWISLKHVSDDLYLVSASLVQDNLKLNQNLLDLSNYKDLIESAFKNQIKSWKTSLTPKMKQLIIIEKIINYLKISKYVLYYPSLKDIDSKKLIDLLKYTLKPSSLTVLGGKKYTKKYKLKSIRSKKIIRSQNINKPLLGGDSEKFRERPLIFFTKEILLDILDLLDDFNDKNKEYPPPGLNNTQLAYILLIYLNDFFKDIDIDTNIKINDFGNKRLIEPSEYKNYFYSQKEFSEIDNNLIIPCTIIPENDCFKTTYVNKDNIYFNICYIIENDKKKILDNSNLKDVLINQDQLVIISREKMKKIEYLIGNIKYEKHPCLESYIPKISQPNTIYLQYKDTRGTDLGKPKVRDRNHEFIIDDSDKIWKKIDN